jgi:hypothetical protein
MVSGVYLRKELAKELVKLLRTYYNRHVKFWDRGVI